MLLWSPSRILKRCRLKKINPIFNKSKSHSMTHSSNICNHPPPVPLRNDLGLAVKIFWGRGQKKKLSAGILLIVTKNLSLNHFLSSESSWKRSLARKRTHNRMALPDKRRKLRPIINLSVMYQMGIVRVGFFFPRNYHLADRHRSRVWR